MIILGIDPSVNNIGLALYDTAQPQKIITKTHHPVRTFAQAGESQSMVYLGHAALRFILVEFLQGKKISKIVIEYPSWQNSTKGLIAMQKGYTLDLAYLSGLLANGFGLASSNIYTPTPMQWKGNRPKSATEAQVRKHFVSLQKLSEHEFDAIGLVLWALKQPGIADTTPG